MIPSRSALCIKLSLRGFSAFGDEVVAGFAADEGGEELARELDFNEASIGANQEARWIGVWFGHPGEDARSAADE